MHRASGSVHVQITSFDLNLQRDVVSCSPPLHLWKRAERRGTCFHGDAVIPIITWLFSRAVRRKKANPSQTNLLKFCDGDCLWFEGELFCPITFDSHWCINLVERGVRLRDISRLSSLKLLEATTNKELCTIVWDSVVLWQGSPKHSLILIVLSCYLHCTDVSAKTWHYLHMWMGRRF